MVPAMDVKHINPFLQSSISICRKCYSGEVDSWQA